MNFFKGIFFKNLLQFLNLVDFLQIFLEILGFFKNENLEIKND